MNHNSLAIIVAFYLSKFNKEGLGFKTDSEAFKTIAQVLDIKKNYIKFRRDEFDIIHPWRQGWKRKMDNRIIKSVEALQDIEEPDLRNIVLNILNDASYRNSEGVKQITSIFENVKQEKLVPGKFILRTPTGNAAEDFFEKYFEKTGHPISGKLIDTRDLGVGYDYRIEGKKIAYVEVKGLTPSAGGILFTSKEWIVANEKGDNYFLCIISNLGHSPSIAFIQNPAGKLLAKQNIYTSIQISWSVTQKQISSIRD